MSEAMIRVRFTLNHPEGLAGESVWATPLEDHRARLENIPFFSAEASAQDVVLLGPPAQGHSLPTVLGVVERGGLRTTLAVFEDDVPLARAQEVVEDVLTAHPGTRCEHGSGPLWAFAAPEDVLDELINTLQGREEIEGTYAPS